MSKLVGTRSVQEVTGEKRRKQREKKLAGKASMLQELYGDLEDEVRQRSHGPHVPLQQEELKKFDDALKSSRTAKVQRSHLRKVVTYLRREYPRRCLGKTDEEILRIPCLSTAEVFKHVAACLGADCISSGSHYLSTWATMLSDEGRLHAGNGNKRKRYARAFAKFGRDYSQAHEFDLDKLMSHKGLLDRAPLCPGGSIFPILAVCICTLLMLRGLATRSMRRRQVRIVSTEKIEIVFGERKNQQAGNRRGLRRTVPLECVCGIWNHACLACKIKNYLQLRNCTSNAVEDSEFLFCDSRGNPLDMRSWCRTIADVAGLVGTFGATQHSCRVTGARWWTAQGLTMGLVMALGDWKCLENLRRYLSTSNLHQRLKRELLLAKTSGGISTAVICSGRENNSAASLPVVVEAAIKNLLNEKPASLALIYGARVPHRWHRTLAWGPSHSWRSVCGQAFNPTTMWFQKWSDYEGSDPTMEACRNCKW